MVLPCSREGSHACYYGCCTNPATSRHIVPSSTAAASRYEFEVSTASSLYPNFQFTNHECLPSFEESFARFMEVYPQYSQTEQADKIRAREYYNLSSSRHVSLDYIGHGLFSYSQLEKLGCPYPGSLEPPFFDISYKSVNLNSYIQYGGTEESEFQSNIKRRIMAFMNISETDYITLLTANQSSAFKLLAESYPFQRNQNLLTVYDYQSEAVELMIQSSKKRGAKVMSAKFSWPNLKIQSEKLRKKIVNKTKHKNNGLFVFPLQSRVTGSRYSYQWMNLAQDNGWHVLLDASALGAKDMETLGLSLFNPNFLICSFFKVFSENPSGFCCLFIKKSTASTLKNSSTSVGIVNLIPTSRLIPTLQKPAISSNQTNLGYNRSKPGNISTQKAVSFSEIEEVIDTNTKIIENHPNIKCRSLDQADSLGLILISSRTRHLINWLVNALMSLQHPHSENRWSAIKIYGPKIMFNRGPSIAFNVFDWNGQKIDPELVQKLADRNNISLSVGFLQNVGFLDKDEEEKWVDSDSGMAVVTGAVGFLTDFEDVFRVWMFVSRFLDADFLEKEKWRYKALNQRTIEM